jgi:hypothetical protein
MSKAIDFRNVDFVTFLKVSEPLVKTARRLGQCTKDNAVVTHAGQELFVRLGEQLKEWYRLVAAAGIATRERPWISHDEATRLAARALYDAAGYYADQSVPFDLEEFTRRLTLAVDLLQEICALDRETVTLDQAAGMVNRRKRTLERYKIHPKHPLPDPDIEGGGGKADEWYWSTIRPWLEQVWNRKLPEKCPSLRGR